MFSSKFVFVCHDAVTHPLSPLYHGPYLVLKHGPKFFRLQVGTREETVSVDRLKPCFSLDPDLVPALPPRRGRPPHPGPAVPQQPVLLPRRPRGRPRRLPLEISVPSPRRLQGQPRLSCILRVLSLGGGTVETPLDVFPIQYIVM